MPQGSPGPVDEHLPEGEPRGRVLVVSDHRPLNLLHADALCTEGYAVYTAVTCTDVPQVFERFSVGELDAVAFASLVHGWHHREQEERPVGIPQATDREWQTRNIREVVDTVRRRQGKLPQVLVAGELVEYCFYDVTADALAEAGVGCQIYPAGDPYAIVAFLQGGAPS